MITEKYTLSFRVTHGQNRAPDPRRVAVDGETTALRFLL